jgi:hypothetical protein
MKNVVFWDVSPCGFCRNRPFGGTYRLHLHGKNNQQTKNTLAIASDCSTLRRINHYMQMGQTRSVSSCFSVTADMTGRCFVTDVLDR